MKTLKNISLRLFRVWRRDLDVYLKTWFVNFMPPFLEPLLYLLAFGLGMGAMVKQVQYQGNELSYINFFAPGIISITVMFNAFYECLYGSFIRMYYQKTFDAIIATPLSIEDVVGGEIFWGASKGAVASLIMLIPISFFGLVNLKSIFLVPMIGFAGGMLFASLGMCFTGICPTIDTFNFPIFVFITPMMLFAGTFFPLDVLPEWARNIAYLLPLTHLVELLRAVMLNLKPINLTGNILMLIGGSVIFFPTALKLMHKRLIK